MNDILFNTEYHGIKSSSFSKYDTKVNGTKCDNSPALAKLNESSISCALLRTCIVFGLNFSSAISRSQFLRS